MIISHDISSLLSPYLQPGQSWNTMTDQQKKEVMNQIPTAKNTVQPTVAKVEVQHSDGLYGAGGNGYISYNGYIARELSDVYLGLGDKKNDAETLKNAVLAMQNREQLAQDPSPSAYPKDPSVSAFLREKNSQCAGVIRKWIINECSTRYLPEALNSPTYLLTEKAGYTQQKANQSTYQALTKIYSAVTPEKLGLQGFADMTGSQMIDALNQFESTISGVMDQISSLFTGKSGGERLTWTAKADYQPETLDNDIITRYGEEYGLEKKYLGIDKLTTDLVDPPEWMLHMFDSLDVTV